MERVSGNDPPYQRWQRRALPLSYTRESERPACLPEIAAQAGRDLTKNKHHVRSEICQL